jgi:hypothetical protein
MRASALSAALVLALAGPAAAGTEERLERLEARAQVVSDLALEVDRL